MKVVRTTEIVLDGDMANCIENGDVCFSTVWYFKGEHRRGGLESGCEARFGAPETKRIIL